ncbi:MAG TPA: hypothetical protein VGW35_18480 [Methylomirabilota bacterium]|nr:hypothetical protein [Methylomirabilota bacterium]
MVISLEDARLCLDCDVVGDREACPACGRRQTFPLAVWLIPLQASQTRPWAGGVRVESGAAARWLARHAPAPLARPPRDGKPAARIPTRWLIVVRAGEQKLFHFLRHRFHGMGSVEVILDRRRGERRRMEPAATPGERRKAPRRRPLSAEERAWWRLAGFRIVGRTESFRLYEAVRN